MIALMLRWLFAGLALVALGASADARRHDPNDAPAVCNNPAEVMRRCPVIFSNAPASVFRYGARPVRFTR